MSASIRPSIPRPRASATPVAPREPSEITKSAEPAVPPPESSRVRDKLQTIDADDLDVLDEMAHVPSVAPQVPPSVVPPRAPVSVASPRAPASVAPPKSVKSVAPPSVHPEAAPKQPSSLTSAANIPAPPRVPKEFAEFAILDREAPPAPPATFAPAPSFVPPPAAFGVATEACPFPFSVPVPAPAAHGAASPVVKHAPDAACDAPIISGVVPSMERPQAAPVMPPANAAVVARAAEPSTLRLSVTDPTDVVFDGLYPLSFLRSTTEAAELCANTLLRALRARSVMIHLHDLISRDMRVIAASGVGDFDVVGTCESSEDDLVASAAICNQRVVTMRFEGQLSRVAPRRLFTIGAPRSLVAAPAMSWGRCLAMVEVIDHDETFSARVADVTTYVAEEFGRFLLAVKAA